MRNIITNVKYGLEIYDLAQNVVVNMNSFLNVSYAAVWIN